MASELCVVVAGHVCLDVIPSLPPGARDVAEIFRPGALVEVGKAAISTGGAVSNTGLALHRLGVRTRLMGKVGDDLWGQAILGILRDCDPDLVSGMIVVPGEATSYTVVLSPPGRDRIFLHAPGANDTFSLEDIPFDQVPAGGIFHFGYPPIMARMYRDGGDELAAVFRRAKEAGAVTSLDMAMPDPSAPAGKAPWRSILAKVLPYVDIFLPSAEEMLLMLEPETYRAVGEQAAARGEGFNRALTGELVSKVADGLLDMGAAVVGLKAGDQGLYLRTASRERLEPLRRRPDKAGAGIDPEAWASRELWVPCFSVEVAGTTGSGDATVAGFLAAVADGAEPEEAMEFAAAVGASSVEAPDATSGIPSAQAVRARMARGWSKRPLHVDLAGWKEQRGIWAGPKDRPRAL